MSLLFLLLAAAPVDARFVLEVQGVPLAALHVRVDGRAYTYEATHFLEEGPAKKQLRRSLDDGTPEVLALLTPPQAGCREVVEERTGRAEVLCVTQTGERTEGTLDGKPFRARYAAGRLSDIEVDGVRWRAVRGPVKPPVENVFARGVAVSGQPRAFEPRVEGARWLALPPRGVGEGDVSRARCLELARAYVADTPGAELAVGLVIDGGRAYPHAWARTSAGAVDPSVLPGDEALSQRQYVELPRAQAGTFFISFFEGRVRLR